MDVLLLVLIGLATARTVRLWREDSVTAPLRELVYGWLGDHGIGGWFSELLQCPFCLSAWVAGAFVVFVDTATSRTVELPLLFWLASWWVGCFGFWLLELVADRDALLWQDREDRGIS